MLDQDNDGKIFVYTDEHGLTLNGLSLADASWCLSTGIEDGVTGYLSVAGQGDRDIDPYLMAIYKEAVPPGTWADRFRSC